MSNVLRRLLIDKGGDLLRVAAPRLQRQIHLLAPDADALFASEPDAHFHAVGAFGLYGLNNESFSMSPRKEVWRAPAWITPLRGVGLWGSKEPAPTPILVSVDRFLSQDVLYYQQTNISRLAVLKFIAFKAGGVHTDEPETDIENVLQSIRQIGVIRPKPDGSAGAELIVASRTFYADAPLMEDVDRLGVDFVLIQLVSAAYYLTRSPDIIELEALLATELKLGTWPGPR